MSAPDTDTLRELIRYDSETGKLYWRPRPSHFFARQSRCDAWNRRFAGQEAFTTSHGGGYRVGSLFCTPLLAHRVAFAIHHGRWPHPSVDHINGVKTDNRASNLREADAKINGRNQKRKLSNSSGFAGVTWCKRRNNWKAQIRVNGRCLYIGAFAEITEAADARRTAEKKYGFHTNHGRVA